jgi:hypothetical protein
MNLVSGLASRRKRKVTVFSRCPAPHVHSFFSLLAGDVHAFVWFEYGETNKSRGVKGNGIRSCVRAWEKRPRREGRHLLGASTAPNPHPTGRENRWERRGGERRITFCRRAGARLGDADRGAPTRPAGRTGTRGPTAGGAGAVVWP